MRGNLLVVLLAVSLTGFAKAQEMSGDKVEEVKKEVMKLEQSRSDTLIKGGSVAADWVKRLDADDMVMIEGNGSTTNKADHIAQFQSGERKDLKKHDVDFQVHVYANGTAAVVTWHASNTWVLKGNTIVEKTTSSDVWVKQDGAWQRILHQTTLIPTQGSSSTVQKPRPNNRTAGRQ